MVDASEVVRPPSGSVVAEGTAGDASRRQLHGMWASVAASWGDYADYADARGAAITARLLELAALRAGDRVLELACGAGGVGLAAAKLVAPGGEVVLSDVVEEMTSIAAARATALGLENVRSRVMDMERIPEPDGSYDVVLCREGLMFAVDPAGTLSEIRRVLRPGGRMAVAVWGPRERNPWLGVVFDAASAHLGVPLPPPGLPGPFALDDADRLAGLLAGAQLADIAINELPTPVHDASFDEWWTRTSSLAGPLAARLAAISEDGRRALRTRVQEAVGPYQTASGLDFPGVTLLASARRP